LRGSTRPARPTFNLSATQATERLNPILAWANHNQGADLKSRKIPPGALLINAAWAFVVAAACSRALPAQTSAIQLAAKLDKAKSQIYVELRNGAKEIYLVRLGCLCGPYGAPDFQFILRRAGVPNRPLVHDYNQRPKTQTPCKKLHPWVVAMPMGVGYGFTFPLSDLRLGCNSTTSLASFDQVPYELLITYRVAVSQASAATWNHNEFPVFPFWAGTVTTTVH